MKKILVSVIFLFSLTFAAFADEEVTKLRLGVMEFTTRAKGVTEQQATAIGDIFARTLTNSKNLLVVERDRIEDIANEHRLAQSGVFGDDEVIQIGKLISCKYMLIGAVTNLEKKISETDLWLVNSTRQEVSATLDVRIVDIETSKVVKSFTESGSSSRKGEGFNFYGFQTDQGKTFEGVEESAIAEAVFRMSFQIREFLAGESVQVVNVTAKEIAVNAGENWGITRGRVFGVYSEGAEVKNLDGTSMGRRQTLVALLRISDVQRDFSYAQIVKNGGKASDIRKGYKLKIMTNKEADDLIKQKFFTKEATGKNTGKKSTKIR